MTPSSDAKAWPRWFECSSLTDNNHGIVCDLELIALAATKKRLALKSFKQFVRNLTD
jgi:hypothetical protein